MGRSSFIGLVSKIARETARQRRLAEAEQRRAMRQQLAEQRATERAWAGLEKEARLLHAEEQLNRAKILTAELEYRISELRRILEATLTVNDTISFDSLRITEHFPPFSPPERLTRQYIAPTEESYKRFVRPLSGLEKLLPGATARYQTALNAALSKFNEAIVVFQAEQAKRESELSALRIKYEQDKAAFEQGLMTRNAEIDDFAFAYAQGDPQAIAGYCTMVLERSNYPDGFPQEFRVAYVPESSEIVVDYELPRPDIVPQAAEYRYVKTRDTIEEKPRKESEIRDIYQDLVAAVALRTCHEVFESDQGNHIAVVAFNGFVQAVDVSTGRDIRPYLISVRVTKERFAELDLARVDKKACLRNLGAQVSPRPDDIQPVKPIVEFDMVDKRFVEQSDILADLESRPNLMDLNPFEFENLVSNLFQQMGLETKLTRSSRDGGVDAVAYDPRPVIGGKVVIQAKRYRNTVGVSAVRDLYGTMMNEGANKGILVTTSGYGPDAFDFAKDKPIELLDGGRLLYLLQQIGVNAKIVFSE